MMMMRMNWFQLKFHHPMKDVWIVEGVFDYNDIMQKIELMEESDRSMVFQYQ
jgi:hypothetical protein